MTIIIYHLSFYIPKTLINISIFFFTIMPLPLLYNCSIFWVYIFNVQGSSTHYVLTVTFKRPFYPHFYYIIILYIKKLFLFLVHFLNFYLIFFIITIYESSRSVSRTGRDPLQLLNAFSRIEKYSYNKIVMELL